MNLLFNRKPKEESTSEITEQPKKKVRGKPFAQGDDPRRHITGRPKLGNTLAERYRNALAEAESEAKEGDYTNLDAIIDVLIGKAKEGDQRAIEYLQERGFGKVPDRLDIGQRQMSWAEFVNSEEGKEITDNIRENLTLEERQVYLYLTDKLKGKSEELSEWVGGKKVPYRLVLTKEYMDTPALPDVVEGTVSE